MEVPSEGGGEEAREDHEAPDSPREPRREPEAVVQVHLHERGVEGVPDVVGQQDAPDEEEPPVDEDPPEVGKAELEVPRGRVGGDLEEEEDRRHQPQPADEGEAEPPPDRVADYPPGEEPYPAADRRHGVVEPQDEARPPRAREPRHQGDAGGEEEGHPRPAEEPQDGDHVDVGGERTEEGRTGEEDHPDDADSPRPELRREDRPRDLEEPYPHEEG